MTQLSLAWSLELIGLDAPKGGLHFMTPLVLTYPGKGISRNHLFGSYQRGKGKAYEPN